MAAAACIATAVLPTPPGPTSVTKRRSRTFAASAATVSSRPISRPTGSGNAGCGGGGGGGGGPGALHGGNRRDEAVAAAGDVDDVALAAAAFVQVAAQRGDVHAQRGLLDHRAGPDLRNQLVLAHHLAGALDQQHQDVQRATAQRHRAAVLAQDPLRGANLEASEGQYPMVHVRRSQKTADDR